jgi:hypothetical protein
MPENKTIGIIQLGTDHQVMETLLAFKSYSKNFPAIHKTIILKSERIVLDTLLREEFENIIYIQNIDPSALEKNLIYLKNEFIDISFSVLINLTYSKSSGYLCSFIKSTYKLGFRYSKSNNLIIDDSWSRYVYSVIMGDNLNSFSMVDIFKSIIGNKKQTTSFPSLQIKKVILNLESEKINLIQNAFPKCEIILIGENLLDFLKTDLKDCLYIGKYSIYSLICSYKSVPCINFYSQKKELFLFMPHGQNNFSALNSNPKISLVNLIEKGKEEGFFKTYQGKGYFIHNKSTLDSTPIEIADLFQEFYKYAFEFCFEDIEELIKFDSLPESTLIELDHYEKATKNLRDLIGLGKKYAIFIIQELTDSTPDFEKIKQYGDKIDEIDTLSAKLKIAYPCLGSLIDYFHYSRLMAQGENLNDITQNIFFIFEEYLNFLEIILELINNIKSRFTIIEKGK